MAGRLLSLGVAASIVLLVGAPGPSGAWASGRKPELQLSTYTIVPGQTVTVTGTGWPVRQSVDATVCGADATSGTADSAVTATATMVATARGLLWAQFTPVLPPQPCPCVVLVTSTNSTYSETIPVEVVGARTEPVHGIAPSSSPQVRLSGLRVVGGATVASWFGGAAPRTLELRITNPGDRPVTPVLVGRWGRGSDPENVIRMPTVRSLGAGQSTEIRARFALGAISVGAYAVQVQVQQVGRPGAIVVSSSTSQWPMGLFAWGLVLLVLLIAILMAATRRRRRRGKAEPQTGPGPPAAVPYGADRDSSAPAEVA